MPKALTVFGLIVAALILIVFGLDLALGGTSSSKIMDITFLISAALLGYISWLAYKQQR